MLNIALLGSTGSIGTQVLNVVRRHSDKFNIVSLSAGNNTELFNEQVKEFKPKVATANVSDGVIKNIGTEYFFGENSFINAIIEEADVVVVSLVGFKGLIAVNGAINRNKNIALANKESLVVGGEIVIPAIDKAGISLAPIDSEHSAIWQALNFDRKAEFKKIIITASGGAFKNTPVKDLSNMTAADALKHPNWNMGAKITVDSATMVNKAFEVTEAHYLYNAPYDKIEVVVHPQSIIHSLVEFEDSSIIAQMGYPNMELPIQMALTYPKRLYTGLESLDLVKLKSLTFEELDNEKYPCFNLCVEAAKKGGLYPAAMNASNEIAVKYFLDGLIKFTDIYSVIKEGINNAVNGKVSIDSLLEADAKARAFAERYIKENLI